MNDYSPRAKWPFKQRIERTSTLGKYGHTRTRSSRLKSYPLAIQMRDWRATTRLKRDAYLRSHYDSSISRTDDGGCACAGIDMPSLDQRNTSRQYRADVSATMPAEGRYRQLHRPGRELARMPDIAELIRSRRRRRAGYFEHFNTRGDDDRLAELRITRCTWHFFDSI